MTKAKYRDGRRNNRPPVKNQFKPGKSGNGKGRPANKSPSSTEIISRLLNAKHSIVIQGRQLSLPLKELIFMRILWLACEGNPKAVFKAMEMIDCVQEAETNKHQRFDREQTELNRKKLENMTEEELMDELRKASERDWS
jgi:hypothetical protein